MRIAVLLASAAVASAATLPAHACSYGKSPMSTAQSEPAWLQQQTTMPAPVEVALRDVWLERMIG